jgi:TPR repeat protein
LSSAAPPSAAAAAAMVAAAAAAAASSEALARTALGLYHAAAALGAGPSQLALAVRYSRRFRRHSAPGAPGGGGGGNPADAEAGAYYFAMAARKAHLTYHALGRQPLHTFDKISAATEATVEEAQRGDEDERLQYQLLRAEEGDVPSMAAMADLLYWGARGFARDHARARRFWLAAAEAGDAVSMAAVAGMFLKGEGVGDGGAPDKAAALRWYKAAANQAGVAVARVRARNGMGYAYFFGGAAGFEKNASAAFENFAAAAEEGLEGDSSYNAAHCLAQGLGAPRDAARAVRYLRRAAHGFGQFDAVYEMGMLFLHGGGLHATDPQEPAQADALAEVHLGAAAAAARRGGGGGGGSSGGSGGGSGGGGHLARLSRAESVAASLRYLEPAARAGEWGRLARQVGD